MDLSEVVMARSFVLVFLLGAALACDRAPARGIDTARAPAGGSDALQAACDEIAHVFRALPDGRVEQAAADSFPAFTGPTQRHGCVVRAEGALVPPASVPYLAGALPDSLGPAWTRAEALVADGPNGTVYGLHRSDVLCLVRVFWNGKEVAAPRPGEPPRYRAEIGCARGNGER